MPTISQQLARWPYLWLVFTLIGSLLLLVPLASASSLERGRTARNFDHNAAGTSHLIAGDTAPTVSQAANKDTALAPRFIAIGARPS